jgi:hypothetical protein
MCNARELFWLVTVTTNNTTTVTEYAYDAAVFPVSFTVVVRKFQNTEEIVRTIYRDLVIKTFRVGSTVSCFLLNVGYKTRPWAGFELIQQRSCVFRHYLTST